MLHNFANPPKGANPHAGVIRDSAGNLYGKLDTTGHLTVLYSFTGAADGANPYAGVTLDSAGNLYGTTDSGGAKGTGVVYKITP